MSEKPKRTRPKPKSPLKRMLTVILWLVILGVACYSGLVIWVYQQEISLSQPADYDSIIVLGAQVLPSGEPSVQLRWRLDKAKEVYDAHPCYIVLSGGQGGNEPEPEGDVMRRVLIAEGVLAEHAISDPVSEDTQDNITNAWTILKGLGCQKPMLVTSDYHLPRALEIMKDAGLEPRGAGSLCKPGINFWLKNHCREALAWVKYWGIKYLGLPL